MGSPWGQTWQHLKVNAQHLTDQLYVVWHTSMYEALKYTRTPDTTRY